MNTKHTPAPWVARIDEIGVDVFQSKSGFGITQIGNYDELRKANYPIEKAKANAKLIAAAPELLEALQRLVKCIEIDDLMPQFFPPLEAAKAAIKKATE